MTKLPYSPTGMARRDEECESIGFLAEFDHLVGNARAIRNQQTDLRAHGVLCYVRAKAV